MSDQPTKVSEIEWKYESRVNGEDHLYFYNMPDGCRLTVVDRITGYGNGQRDIETGFRDDADLFWLASGMFDIRDFPDLSIADAIEKVKCNSNTVRGS